MRDPALMLASNKALLFNAEKACFVYFNAFLV